jgi:L-lysine 2,3-aminomutase
VVIPDRVTEALVTAIQELPVPLIMVMHINHAQEIDVELTRAVMELRQGCRSILNQAVMLRGVNDSVESQIALSEALYEAGIDPYYLNVLDSVQGASHFYVEMQAIELIYRQMLRELPGFLVPTLVREVPQLEYKLRINSGV